MVESNREVGIIHDLPYHLNVAVKETTNKVDKIYGTKMAVFVKPYINIVWVPKLFGKATVFANNQKEEVINEKAKRKINKATILLLKYEERLTGRVSINVASLISKAIIASIAIKDTNIAKI
ncbi:MAG: hypothetical protein LBV37_00655 [Mycoplasmataceae bacterium]|jgi:hypothetical protein|nr:hypothetical protein [Mycoplasmataceae bacterium]